MFMKGFNYSCVKWTSNRNLCYSFFKFSFSWSRSGQALCFPCSLHCTLFYCVCSYIMSEVTNAVTSQAFQCTLAFPKIGTWHSPPPSLLNGLNLSLHLFQTQMVCHLILKIKYFYRSHTYCHFLYHLCIYV